jgi:hypothetical protein
VLRLTYMSLSSFVFSHFAPSSDLVEVLAPIPVFGELESLNLRQLSTILKEMCEDFLQIL